MRKIKLIWDFKGIYAFKTAEHHAIHLKEFAEKENLEFMKIDFSKKNELHAIAFIVVHETEMIILRDALKPHRAELYTE